MFSFTTASKAHKMSYVTFSLDVVVGVVLIVPCTS